jgi:hypothetical protein
MRTNLQKMESPRFLYGKVHRNLRYGLADFCREKKINPIKTYIFNFKCNLQFQMQFAISNAICNFKCNLQFQMQFAIYNLQFAIYNLQFTIHNLRSYKE